VVLPFPFSDLSSSKRRPALVIAPLRGNDVILCMITSRPMRDPLAIPLTVADFAHGELPVRSYIRPTRLFTADGSIIQRSVGQLTSTRLDQVLQTLIAVISGTQAA
jgi:mRNA interferase MazF